jgi:hypothetical protein
VNKARKYEQQQQIKQELRDQALESFQSRYSDAKTIYEKMDQMEEVEEKRNWMSWKRDFLVQKLFYMIIS